MSGIRFGGAAAIVVALAVPGAAAPEPSPSPDVQRADPQLLRAVHTIAGHVAALVGGPKDPSVVALRAPRDVRDAAARARAARILALDRAAARGRAWADLGLGSEHDPADLVEALARDLQGMTLGTDGRQILVDPDLLRDDAGKADPDADDAASLLLATGLTPDEAVAAHFVTHAILDPGVREDGATTDAILARAALAEGAANVAALTLLFGGLGLESEVVSGALHPEDTLGGRLVPTVLTTSSPTVTSFLQFAYLDGFAQAASLVKAGGFRRLALERRRRGTTRDVLHLDRAPSAPQAFEAPRLPGGSPLRVADRDAIGEQGIITLVSLGTGKDNLGLIAGDGWTGDALWRLEAPGRPDGGVTLWQAKFATDEDAKDMTYSLGRCLGARFPGVEPTESPEGGSAWTANGKVYRVSRNGIEVSFRIAGVSEDLRLQEHPSKKGAGAPTGSPKVHRK